MQSSATIVGSVATIASSVLPHGNNRTRSHQPLEAYIPKVFLVLISGPGPF
jgi:hypothetical protein